MTTRTAESVLADTQHSSDGVQTDQRFRIGLALLTVYIIWGTTYLAIRFALVSFPPYLMMGIRFIMAGGGLFTFLWLRGAALPTRKQLRGVAIVGGLLMVGGMGTTALVEQQVTSGLAAMLAATSPIWAMLFSMLWHNLPTRREWIGVGLGIAGVAVLSLEGNLQANPAGVVLMIIAAGCWSLGSVWSRHLEMPQGAMANASEMLIGGVMLMGVAMLRGEHISGAPTTSALLALAYLTTFGSLATMTAYMYLLKTVRPALATSYSFVNPAIALVLGVLLGGEHLTGSALAALPVIILGVAFVALRKK